MGSDHGLRRERNVGIDALTNIAFTIIEAVVGLATNSLALIADSLHDLGDSIVLGIAWILERFSNSRKPDSKMTFGYSRLSVFSSILAGVVLVSGSVLILYKAVPRLFNP